MKKQNVDPVCCPKFDPAPWDGKKFVWKGKKFIQDHVFTVFYMPINFGAVMTRIMGKIDAAKAKVPDNLCLSEHTSLWNMNVHTAVNRDIPGVTTETIDGTFISKVYEGPFQDMGKWMEDFSTYTQSQNIHVIKQYVWYTTCPECAKKYGKNYVVLVGKIG
jgi:hypothetical protein